MSLLDEIQASETSRLIEFGNLERKKKADALAASLPSWALKPWIFTGYKARIQCFHCLACGAKSDVLLSVSVCEAKDDHTNPTREIPLDISKPLQLSPEAPKDVAFIETNVYQCAECVFSLGF